MGLQAERLTRKKVLPASPAEIKSKVKTMREAQPRWVWDAVAELEKKIREGQVTIPLAVTKPDIERWRGELGYGPRVLPAAALRMPRR
jgi:basic membrane protein A